MDSSIILFLFVLGFAPGLFWLGYFYHKDKLEPEPLRLVFKAGLLGSLAAVAGYVLEMPFSSELFAAVIAAPVIEESLKFSVVRLAFFNDPEFDEPMDGVVYAAAAALGFASLENVMYLVREYASTDGNVAVVFYLRSILSVPGHVLFSTFWGEALGRAKFLDKASRRNIILMGLGGAMLAHSVWNAMCELNIGIGIAYFLVPQLWRHFNAHIIDLTALSPFQKDNIPIHRRGSRKRSAAARTTPDGDSANMLPLVGVCFACNKVMKLSYKERISGQFVCPACGITNIRSLRAETGLGQGDFDVTPLLTYVECPACKAELELNREERASAEFACPECQAHYAQREHPGNGKLREFNLPGIAVCPLCGYEQHLIGDVRKEHEYTCKNCGEVIESVDG